MELANEARPVVIPVRGGGESQAVLVHAVYLDGTDEWVRGRSVRYAQGHTMVAIGSPPVYVWLRNSDVVEQA